MTQDGLFALPPADPTHQSLVDRFLVPPFSVLDARQGYWQERKQIWLSLGIKSDMGRGEDTTGERLTYVQGDRALEDMDDTSQRILATGPGTSIFDPVLCELIYRWFSPVGGSVLDPFAGGSVRGIVAGILSRSYLGIDLSPDQVQANVAQRDEIWLDRTDPLPEWSEGDSRHITNEWPDGGPFDLCFSCPPYFDLEVYTDHPQDLSRCANVSEFMYSLELILAASVRRMNPHRFVVLVMGEARDKSGCLYGLIPGTISAAQRAGLRYYNEIAFVTMTGSLPIRAGRQFVASRKIGRTHQTVLVFVHGDPRKATEACGPVQVPM